MRKAFALGLKPGFLRLQHAVFPQNRRKPDYRCDCSTRGFRRIWSVLIDLFRHDRRKSRNILAMLGAIAERSGFFLALIGIAF